MPRSRTEVLFCFRACDQRLGGVYLGEPNGQGLVKERSRGRCCLPDTAEPTALTLITRIPAKVYSYCRDNKAQRISLHPSTLPSFSEPADTINITKQRGRTETASLLTSGENRLQLLGYHGADTERGMREVAVPQTRDLSPQQHIRAHTVHIRAAGSPRRAWEVCPKHSGKSQQMRAGESRGHCFAFTSGMLRHNDTE